MKLLKCPDGTLIEPTGSTIYTNKAGKLFTVAEIERDTEAEVVSSSNLNIRDVSPA